MASKVLVVVESPAKAKTIGRFLDDSYMVEASYGHVRDLPQNAKEIPTKVRDKSWARLGVNVDDDFEPVYVVPADKKKHVKRLKDALKDAGSLLLATDEDREGESISWHILQLLKPKKGTDVRRIVFHEVTPEAIREALESPRTVDENLVHAQEARRVVDRLYGYSLSPLLWKRVAPGLSAGRVQSVAVRLAVQRERDRIAFHTAAYWDLSATLKADAGQAFKARLQRLNEQRLADGKSFDSGTGKLKDASRQLLLGPRAQALASGALEARPWTVTSLETKPGTQKPAPPFITSTLQQEANRKLRFTARRTMQIAQSLYEGIDLGGERVGLITYMRTDGTTLAERALDQARSLIASLYGEDYLPKAPIQYRSKAKRAQEAHEAIRPTDLSRRPQDVKPYLDAEQLRLYELIWKRTLACQMVPARIERTTLEVTTEVGEDTLVFATSGRRIAFPGFLRAYVEGSDDPEAQLGDQETILPALKKGQTIEPTAVEADEHVTRPPARYTEASLVKKLEEEGIGRPSTYASIISTIQDRGYVFKRGNELVPTFTAFCVTQLLEEQFGDLVDTHFTARMEDDLDDIAAGARDWTTLVSEFFRGGDTEEDPGLAQRVEGGEVTYPSITLGVDPDTEQPILVKIGRYGPYIRRGDQGAANEAVSIPDDMPPDELDLGAALKMLAEKAKGQEALTQDPVTGRDIFLQRGRFGPYLELAQTEEEKESKEKPRRTSLPRGLEVDDLTAPIAQRLIQLPRDLGVHPEDEKPLLTGLGRFGPFLKHGSEFRSLASWEQACDLTIGEAVEILKTPKPTRGRRGAAPKKVIKELGELEGAAGPVQLLEGRYGPYVTDGKTNASLPKGMDPGTVDAAVANKLLTEKRASGGGRKKRTTRRKR